MSVLSSVDVIVSELLCFIQNKADILDENSIVLLCEKTFTEADIANASATLCDVLKKNKRSQRYFDAKKVIIEIIKFIKETEPENLPTFVAKNLQKLPPITFDYVDVTCFLKEFTVIKHELSELKKKNDSDNSVQISKLKEEVEKLKQVLGPIDPSNLGRTLTHEHFALDFRHFYRQPPSYLTDRFKNDGRITLDNVGFVRQYPYSSANNLSFFDCDSNKAVLNDVIAYRKYGGGAIVENTTSGLGRNLSLMKQVSKASGVSVIAGTGHYIADLQTQETKCCTVEMLYEHMLSELTNGCLDDGTVKAGFMGEIASVWPIADFEKRSIKASGEVQSQLKCGVSFHPHRVKEAPFEIMRLYLEAGGASEKAVMSHLDRTLIEPEDLLEFAKFGGYCQFDLFGIEVSMYQLNLSTDMPSDAQRIKLINHMIEEGLTNRVLMSHDIHTKHRLIDYGGHGYSHIINNVIPKMLIKGITQEKIDQITITNPANWLTIPK